MIGRRITIALATIVYAIISVVTSTINLCIHGFLFFFLIAKVYWDTNEKYNKREKSKAERKELDSMNSPNLEKARFIL